MLAELLKTKQHIMNNIKIFKSLQIKNETSIKNINNKTYHIIKCNNERQNDLFIAFSNYFATLSKLDEEDLSICLDFEFNTRPRTIALMQITFEELDQHNLIFIVYPPDILDFELFIQKILINPKIKKIIHGSEAIDMPYIIDELLLDYQYISAFFENFVDTRYLCEYYMYDTETPAKCSIYDLLLATQVISKHKYDWLLENEEKMGKLYEQNINIYNMSKELTLYSAYDTLYLKYLDNKFIEYDTYIYEQVLPKITATIFFERKMTNISLYEKIKNNIILINNYRIKGNVMILDIYNYVFEKILPKIIVNKCKLSILIKINYFKRFFEYLTKILLYCVIGNKTKIYSSLKENKEYKMELTTKIIHDYYKNNKYLGEMIDKIINLSDRYIHYYVVKVSQRQNRAQKL